MLLRPMAKQEQVSEHHDVTTRAPTLSKKTFDEVGVWRQTIHPLPPAKFSKWLQHSVAVFHVSIPVYF